MDIASILKYVANHPAKRVKIAVADIDGILRGKYISSEKFVSIIEKGMGFCDVIFGWDMEDALYDKGKISGWHAGFPDSPAVLDVHTFRKIPWENDLPFFLGEMDPLSSHAAAVCPRQLLKNTRVTASNMGFTPFLPRNLNGLIFRNLPILPTINSIKIYALCPQVCLVILFYEPPYTRIILMPCLMG